MREIAATFSCFVFCYCPCLGSNLLKSCIFHEFQLAAPAFTLNFVPPFPVPPSILVSPHIRWRIRKANENDVNPRPKMRLIEVNEEEEEINMQIREYTSNKSDKTRIREEEELLAEKKSINRNRQHGASNVRHHRLETADQPTTCTHIHTNIRIYEHTGTSHDLSFISLLFLSFFHLFFFI